MNRVNEELRQHVTRVGFDLSLGRTHIAALVMLDAPFQRSFSHFVGGARGLQERGLVWHRMPPNNKTSIRKIWGITKAGELVKDLLKEAGIWQEYEAALPIVDRSKGRKAS